MPLIAVQFATIWLATVWLATVWLAVIGGWDEQVPGPDEAGADSKSSLGGMGLAGGQCMQLF